MLSFIRTKIRELYSICKKVPSIGRQRNYVIYKGAEQLFALYYSLLTFFAFDYLVSLKFTNCFHTSLIGSLRKRIKPDAPLIFNWELF